MVKPAILEPTLIQGSSPDEAPNVEVSILADAGYDFLLFDTQHSPWEIKQLQPSIQAMRGKQAAPVVRVAASEAYQICFALDAGARGIIAPMINTRAEAEAMVRACRYFPDGRRGRSGERPDRPARAADHSFRYADAGCAIRASTSRSCPSPARPSSAVLGKMGTLAGRRGDQIEHTVFCCRLDVAAARTFDWGAEPPTDTRRTTAFGMGVVVLL